MLKPTHGPTNTMMPPAASASISTRRRVVDLRAPAITGTATRIARSETSERERTATPIATPSHHAFHREGRAQNVYAASRITETVRIVIDSDSSIPSLIQRFAYTAAIAAATSPARSPIIFRPVRPSTTTDAVPRKHDATRCAVTLHPPSHEIIPR